MNNVNRKALTDALILHLETQLDFPVGDADKPEDGGYAGEWGKSDFTPYVVLTPEGGGQGEGPFGDSQADIEFSYAISGFGISRKQCEWVLDETRNVIFGLRRSDVDMTDGSSRRIRNVTVSSYGPVDRSEGPEPHWWMGTDGVVLDTTPS